MGCIRHIQSLALYFGKGYDYTMIREGEIMYVFAMRSMPCIPAILHLEAVMDTVAGLARFGKSVRIVSSVDSYGRYVLPDIDELERAAEEDY